MGSRLDRQLDEAWDEKKIDALHSDIVTDFLLCETEKSHKMAIEFVKVMRHIGLDKESYPFFMELFLHEDDQVILALLEDGKVLESLEKIQRSTYLIELCFELLRRFKPKQVYEKIIVALLKILNMTYHNANSGYWVFPLTIQHLYYMGKFLDKSKPQTYKLNRLILDTLADLGDMSSKDHIDPVLFDISSRANQIRNVFFDKRVSMNVIIPPMMLPD